MRTSTGNLVKRIHIRYRPYYSARGYSVIDRDSGIQTNMIGDVCNIILANPQEYLTTKYRGILELATLASQNIFVLENRLSFIFRAFDAFTKEIRKPTSKEGFIDEKPQLDSKIITELKKLLRKTGRAINKIAKTLEDEQKNWVSNKVAQRVFDAMNESPRKPNEAEAVLKFTKQLGLHDADVIPNQEEWIQKYNKYRNIVIHDVVFLKEHYSETKNMNEMFALTEYLHDLLIRTILKSIDYNGLYIPVTKDIWQTETVDWVKPDTDPSELGFKNHS